MFKKIFVMIVVGAVMLGFSGMALADGVSTSETEAIPRAELSIARAEIHESRIALLENSPIDGPRTLAEEFDFFGTFLGLMLETASPIVVFDTLESAYAGVSFDFYQDPDNIWSLIVGFVPDGEGVLYGYVGAELKEVPLVGQLGSIFDKLSLLVTYGLDNKIRIGASYLLLEH